MTTRQKQSLIRRINNKHARGRQCYEKADTLFQTLLAGMTVGEIVETPDGKVTLVDNFAESNTAYRVARVARYELKPVKEAKPKKPAAEPTQEASSAAASNMQAA